MKLIKSREIDKPLRKRRERSNMTQTLKGSHVGLQAPKQKKARLKHVMNLEDQKSKRTTEERKHNMITRALKSKMHKNGEKLSKKPAEPLRVILEGRQRISNKVVMKQIVDCGAIDNPLITSIKHCNKESDDKDEIVTSTELKRKIKISREGRPRGSNVQHGKRPKNTAEDGSIQSLLKQSVYFAVPKLVETENKDCSSHCFTREVKACCNDFSVPATSAYCSQLGEIRNPVVKLLDCCYIRALLKPAGSDTVQWYKVHSQSLHVGLDQNKVQSYSHRGMGQNDLSSSPGIVQTGTSFPQSGLVKNEICQNCKNSSGCKNGAQLRDSVNSEQLSKEIKNTGNLERSLVQDISDMNYGQQLEDESSVLLKNLNYNETPSISLFDHVVLPLQQPAEKFQNQFDNLSSEEKVNEVYSQNGAGVLKEKDSVSNDTGLQIDFSNKLDNSIGGTLVCHKIASSSSSRVVDSCVKRRKKKAREKTVSKNVRGQLLYSCQRAVPISGKNVWPHDSCARTSLWVCKNLTFKSEREPLNDPDLVVNSSHAELCKPLTGTSSDLTNKVMKFKTEFNDKSPGSVFLVSKPVVAISNEKRTSVHLEERTEQYSSSEIKNTKKSKMRLNSSANNSKTEGIIAKRISPSDTQNDLFADNKKGHYQKTAKQVKLKTGTGNLTNFKIPLLKHKNEGRHAKHTSQLEEETCSSLDGLDHSTLENKVNAKDVSHNSSHLFKFEEINGIAPQKYTDQSDNQTFENTCKKRNNHGVIRGVGISDESDQELFPLKSPDTSTINCIEKATLDSVVATENGEDNYSSSFEQDNADLHADVLKDYEDDVLVIDVIQDDPELFGDTEGQESTERNEHYVGTNSFSKENLKQYSPQSLESGHLNCPRESFIADCGALKSDIEVCSSQAKVDEVKTEPTSEISSAGGVTNEEQKIWEKTAFKKEKAENMENIKIESPQCTDSVSCDSWLELPILSKMGIASQQHIKTVKPWMNDFRFSRKGPVSLAYPGSYESLALSNLGLTLPLGYCRRYFNTLNGCERMHCRYSHVLSPGNDKIFSEILTKYISIGEAVLLQRAVQMLTDYYQQDSFGPYLNSQMLNDLLTALLQSCLMKELFHVLHISTMIKILPSEDILCTLFEQVASKGLRNIVPDLINISCKLVDAGMVVEYESVKQITKFLNQLKVPSQEMSALLSRFQARHFRRSSLYDFDSTIVEFQHCKENGDWAKLGILYVNVRKTSENYDELEKYSLCIADILTSAVQEERSDVPFCEFATAVNTDINRRGKHTILLGRIGISVMFSYYKIEQWLKAKKVLDMLHALKIPFTLMKGLHGQEKLATRCQIVNTAVEIFLKCGHLDGALSVLRESDWIISTASWPCDRMDVLNRHNLLCTIANEYSIKYYFKEAFEVLKNLPGFQNSCGTLDVSQYNFLFNKLLGASSENKNLGISSSIVEFMIAKNIPIDIKLLRELITALGRSCSWIKAREHYKSAVLLGCYLPLAGNPYRKLLQIPSYMTEIEMLFAIEVFLVSNCTSVQSPGASNQILQIVLKRCEDSAIQNKTGYQNAEKRLIQAAQISNPKLFIKHLTLNVNMEEVYSLEYASVQKWLKENINWAEKVWHP